MKAKQTNSLEQFNLKEQEVETTKRVLNNPYIPHFPTERQWDFLLDRSKDLFYGGSAGGGKTDALLMAALMYVDCRDYNAIIFRRTFPNLNQAEGVIPRSRKWMIGTDADYNSTEHRWTFPSGATLSFGHMRYLEDRLDYNSAEFQYIGFDEAAEFEEKQFTFLFSRLRRTVENPIPLRFRSAGNPIGPGVKWIKERYVEGDKPFIPSSLNDNPHLDEDEYTESLQNLDPVTRQKILDGNWDVTDQEGLIYDNFSEEENMVDSIPKINKFWIGIDYGTTNPTHFNLIGFGEDKKFYLIDEWRHSGKSSRSKTDKEYSKDLQNFLRKQRERFNNFAVEWILIDPSAKSFITQLQRDNVNRIAQADNEVLGGIRGISALLEANKLLIHKSCEETIDEFYSYRWDEKATERGDEKPIKKNDHSCDALRYIFNSVNREYNMAMNG